jgi:hypothetical protein
VGLADALKALDLMRARTNDDLQFVGVLSRQSKACAYLDAMAALRGQQIVVKCLMEGDAALSYCSP